jgi:hypothetical protein
MAVYSKSKSGNAKVSKYKSNALAATFSSISNDWIIAELLDIDAGTGEQERTGQRIFVETLNLGFTLVGGQSNGIADDVYNTVRVVVVIGAESLESADWTQDLNAPKLRNVFPKVRSFLHDQFHTLSVYGTDSTGYVARAKRIDVKIPINRFFEYESIDGQSYLVDSLFIGVKSDSAAIPNPGMVGPSAAWVTFKNTGI